MSVCDEFDNKIMRAKLEMLKRVGVTKDFEGGYGGKFSLV